MECENRGIDQKLFDYLIHSVAATQYYQLNGISLQALSPGKSEFMVTTGPQHCNPMGIVHGGLFTAMADAAMGNSIRSLGMVGVTCNLSANFIASVPPGETIVAKGSVTKAGRTMLYAEAEVRCGDKIIMKAIGSFFRIGDVNPEQAGNMH